MAEPELGRPFCGMTATALDRAATGLCRWSHSPVTLAHQMALPAANIPTERITGVFRECVRLWSSVSGIDLRYQDDPNANILARAEPMDGPNGVLGESYLPCGNVNPRTQLTQRYDAGELWTVDFFLGVALHEIGHALGLSHAPVGSGAVMEPFLTGHRTPQPWDVAEMVARHGPFVALPPEPPPPAPTDPASAVPLKIGVLSPKVPVRADSARLFRFRAHAEKAFVAETSGAGYWVMTLLDSGMGAITTDEGMHGAGGNARIAAKLEPGDYFLRVEGYFPGHPGVVRVKVVAR